MERYRAEQGPTPRDLAEAVQQEWQMRELRRLEVSIDSAHDLDMNAVEPSPPRYGMMRYFTADASPLWGEGPYVYKPHGDPLVDLWYPMFPPLLNQGVSTPAAAFPISVGTAWTLIISGTITSRIFSQLSLNAMINAYSAAPRDIVDIEYRFLLNGVEDPSVFHPFWYLNMNSPSITPEAGFTTTLAAWSSQWNPTVPPFSRTDTITIEARSSTAGITEVTDAFLDLQEVM